MTNKELLTLAAKASRINLNWPVLPYESDYVTPNILGEDTSWNPLEDYGDAMCLVIKLRLSIYMSCAPYVTVIADPNKGQYAQENFTNNPYAATRRAIVRCAAEIGKQMENKTNE